MPALTRKFRPEFYAHALLYLPMVGAYALTPFANDSFIVGLILQFFVGFFQVITGLIHTLADRSVVHTKYLLGVIFYFLLFGFGIHVFQLSNSLEDIFILLMTFVVPVGIATWYMNMTSWYYGGKYEQEVQQVGEDDLLDDLQIEG